MPGISLTEDLKKEYERLFSTCVIRQEHEQQVENIINKLQTYKARYENVGNALGIPWFFIAVIHNMESSLNFTKHLHNGDPLTARTINEPAGRPISGNPPFSWEESANDALLYEGFGSQTDWSLAAILYRLERYNGWGYRRYHPHVLSPYLWGFSEHYECGKYIGDKKWSETAVSDQCGAAVLLRRMSEHGQIDFGILPIRPFAVAYSMTKSDDPTIVESSMELQRWLNTFPGIYVKVDGIPGIRTSTAYKSVTGSYLPEDPRI
jgi:lysozyme family protein